LWDEGFDVFHNVGSTGPVDVIALKDGEVYLFDVKMCSKKGSNAKAKTPIQKELGVQYILFDPKTRKLRLQRHRK
tara:strand:+ start:2646 stop:2870 length:225 start_codon:yes stop_codon:yes gene_type:complete